MRPDHDILHTPLEVDYERGSIEVLKVVASGQSGMGEALTLDGTVNSIDGELIAKGLSGKGPDRGAIVRHGRFTLWGFEGGVDDMTELGKRLFVNTVFYAAKQAKSDVLERKLNQTRDGLFTYLDLARNKSPGFLRTMAQYIPESARGKSLKETERWVVENRPYLYAEGRVFHVDELAKKLGIPNHRRAYLEKCIANLREREDVSESAKMLIRYTGCDEHGESYELWEKWYAENREYLFFSDCDGSRFIVDERAKARRIPTEEFRGWSSEEINYR